MESYHKLYNDRELFSVVLLDLIAYANDRGSPLYSDKHLLCDVMDMKLHYDSHGAYLKFKLWWDEASKNQQVLDKVENILSRYGR